MSCEYVDPYFLRALAKQPDRRSLQDLQIIYYGLCGLDALSHYRDSTLRQLCKIVRYEHHQANDVLYYTGELSNCWYILLSGSVFIDGAMFLPFTSFGQRTAGSARRPNECFVLEPSDMIVVDYGEGGGGVRRDIYGSTVGYKSNRSSSTSSAYSGSDTMTCHSVDPDEIDLSGLVESIVDSDEEDLAESTDSLTVRDTIRECLEKDPTERTEEDIENLLEFTQHLKAFTNMTLAVRRALVSVMVFAVVEKAGTLVMNDGEELDSWSVLVNGHVEIEHSNGQTEQLHMGDSFGIMPTMDKLYHRGVMRTKSDDCQFVCITQTDYYRIQHQGQEAMTRHTDAQTGDLTMVTELRTFSDHAAPRRGHIVIRGTPEKLMLQLVEENSIIDPTYVEDFLLTHRTFIDGSVTVAKQLLEWFTEPTARDRVTRVILLWVNNHFTDFETNPSMMELLEVFEGWLEREKMTGQLRLLNIACAAKARPRTVTLARPSRDDVLHFSILGGYEMGYGIFISKVEKGCKAEDVGLKRADQILEVNGHSFEHIPHTKALEILRASTHLSITVKSNLLGFKELLETAGSGGRGGTLARRIVEQPPPPPPLPPAPPPPPPTKTSFMTLAPKKRLQKALIKMNILPKIAPIEIANNDSDAVDSTGLVASQDLVNHICYEELRSTDYPEHVLKVYKADQSCKYLLVHKETTAHEVVMLSLQEFGITEPSSRFSLCEVSVSEGGGMIKQKRLPEQLQNLAERIGLSSRYYLKTNGVTETLVSDELAVELVRESSVHFLQLNAVEVAVQLTLQDFAIFRQIESTEYVDDLFELHSRYGTPMLTQFQELVNREMFWVVTEVCSENNLVRRFKIIKQFIKVARQCKECKNFNSMFAIVSGLGHGAVSRLRMTWDKLPSKYQRMLTELQGCMDPSRNMSKYRQLINSAVPPMIPFYPVVKKDLTFIHLGNDSKVESLINFEKLRMIAKEIRTLTNMCSSPYDLLTMLELGGQPASSAMVAMNQLTTGSAQQTATVKRRKKSTGAPNPKKMFEEAQMVRRVKAYLNSMKVIVDEEKLHDLSLLCEGSAGGGGGGSSSGSVSNNYTGSSSSGIRRRQPSPTLSTASSTSSTSADTALQRKQLIAHNNAPTQPKFGSASPQAVRKLLSLSEGSRTRQPSSRASPPVGGIRRGIPSIPCHERSHSDTHPTPLLHLSPESSSVTSMPLRKTLTSGSVTSSDSGHSTAMDSHSTSSAETPVCPQSTSPPPWRIHMPPIGGIPPHPHHGRPPFMHAISLLPPLPLGGRGQFSSRLGRAHSLEGVTRSTSREYYHQQGEDDENNISSV